MCFGKYESIIESTVVAGCPATAKGPPRFSVDKEPSIGGLSILINDWILYQSMYRFITISYIQSI